MKQTIYIILLAMLSTALQAQMGNIYQMKTDGISGKTVDGGFNEATFYILLFKTDSVGIWSYTIKMESNREQQFSTITRNKWQYFKWQRKNNTILIAGLPDYYAGWITKLQIKADNLTSINYKDIEFVKQKQPLATNAVIGKSYAVKIGDNKYLALTFDKDSVWLEYWKNIDPRGKLLAYDETQKTKKYKWMGYGTHILIPDCSEYPIVDFKANKLLVIHLGQQYAMTEEVPYQRPIACSTIEVAPVKKQGKDRRKKPSSIRVYKP